MSMTMKMKRKELDDVTDDFSDFSLCSPARKIRRLDAELKPMMEEEVPEIYPEVFPTFIQEKKQQGPIIEELPEENANEERAIVLFKPVYNRLLHSSNLSVSLDSDIISGFKNQFWSKDRMESVELEEDTNNTTKDSNCKAVVPWIPSPLPPKEMDVFLSELMDAEEMGEAAMVIEDNNSEAMNTPHQLGGLRVNCGLHQWDQQHCLISQLPESYSTPITWLQ